MVETSRKKGGARLVFDVWQFVRVMVELEKREMKSAAYRAWWKDWKKLDRRLERLGRADAGAFSRLMMDEEVVIEEASPDQVADVVRALDAVIRKMNTEIQKGVGDEEHQSSLAFERTALIALRDGLKGSGPKGRRRRPPSAR